MAIFFIKKKICGNSEHWAFELSDQKLLDLPHYEELSIQIISKFKSKDVKLTKFK